MEHLQSSIALRIIDCLGVITKDMPDIRHKLFKLKKQETWAAKTMIDESASIIALYSESGGKKYMITRIVSENEQTKKTKLWFCIICGDETEENPELNRIFALNVFNEKYMFRETSVIEIANILVTFECVRNYCVGWTPYDANEEDIGTIKDFVNSIKEENA